jgi:hypothetical protein
MYPHHHDHFAENEDSGEGIIYHRVNSQADEIKIFWNRVREASRPTYG